MKINDSYYVIINKENNYYNQEEEWWYKDIRDATRYENYDQASGMSEYLNMYTMRDIAATLKRVRRKGMIIN